MLIAILASIIVFFLLVSFVCVVVFWKVRKIQDELVTFFTAPDDKTASPFAQLVEVMSHTAGRAVAMEVKTTLMGKASGASRAEQAVTEAIAQDAIGQTSPVAGLLMNAFPTLGKKVLRSPGLLELAMTLLSNYAAKKAGVGNNGSSSSSLQSSFKL